MAEQIILIRHGYSEGNFINRDDHEYVQGLRSGLHERGYRQIGWSAMQLCQLINAQDILPPTAIYHARAKRLIDSAKGIHDSVLEHTGIDLPVRILPALEEKREPIELEDKTGPEIMADPQLRTMKDMVRYRHLDDSFSGEHGIDVTGFETWPQVFARVSLMLREIIAADENPILVTSNGPSSIARAQLDHNLDLMLQTDVTNEEAMPGIITPQQLFDQYLFKMGNAEGVVYRRDKEGGWKQTQNWKRPEEL